MGCNKNKQLEEVLLDLVEIDAYRELDGQDFDFGTGLITNDMSYGSEDAYYEMAMWGLESYLEDDDDWRYPTTQKRKRKKKKDNRYAKKRKHIEKMKKLASDDDRWWYYPVYNNDRYNKRWYRGKRSAYLKKQSSRKIRRYKGDFEKKGNVHKRVFDFWYELN